MLHLVLSTMLLGVDFTQFVNPFIGTANDGSTYPGATTPYGMVQFSPSTLTGEGGGYEYGDKMIRGFSLTHLSGTGCGDVGGDIPIMPYPGGLSSSPSLADPSTPSDKLSDMTTVNSRDKKYMATFSHHGESATAGYYRVRLDNGITAELTATPRTGSGRFTYPAGAEQTILIRASDSAPGSTAAQVDVDASNHTVSGSVTSGGFCGVQEPYYTLYFVAQFDRPIANSGTWETGTVHPHGTHASGATGWEHYFPIERASGSGAYVTFTPSTQPVTVRVGVSFVSAANALANLQAENPTGTSFNTSLSRAKAVWNNWLGRISIDGATDDQRSVFYTALYHVAVQPNLQNDVNGQYRGLDLVIHTLAPGQHAQYSNFDSLWDIYRSDVQLVTFLDPAIGSDFAQSLLNGAQQYGMWDRTIHQSGVTHVMSGDPADPTVASIVAFGGTNFDQKAAYQSLLRAATVPTPADIVGCQSGWCNGQRYNLDQWLNLHYIAANSRDHYGSAADSLEFATADFALSQLAQRYGDVASAQLLLDHSHYWVNLFDPNAPDGGYIAGKDEKGQFVATKGNTGKNYVEGTAAIYLWMVPFDEAGLAQKLGGTVRALQRLDAFFHNAKGDLTFVWPDNISDENAQPATADLTNEPSLETPWLYDFFGAPYKTQETIRAILNNLWKNSPSGIAGNDDMGEMSSWYVFAAMGMYPEIPGRADMTLASPLFSHIHVHRRLGDLDIIAQGASTMPYLTGLQVNGVPSTRPWIPGDTIVHGGSISFTLSAQPDTTWGSALAAAPPSFAPSATEAMKQ